MSNITFNNIKTLQIIKNGLRVIFKNGSKAHIEGCDLIKLLNEKANPN